MTTHQHRRGSHSGLRTHAHRASRRRAAAAVTATALLVTGAGVAIAEVTKPNPTHLVAFGPISGEHGYPTWYEDVNGTRLQQCLDLDDPYCDPAFLRGEMPDPESPISFPDNWPLESFYFLAGALIEMPGGGKAILTSGLEATMANEGAVDGDQVVFGRQRFDIDFPGPGTYVVTHPYGEDTFTVNSADYDDFRYVEDITPAPGNFGLALRSRISPFLEASSGRIVTDKGTYVGDPGTPTTVTGSPHGTNFFRVEQVVGGERVLIGTTDEFSLMGKVATNTGVSPMAATFVETETGRYLDVFATTDAGKAVSVSGQGIASTVLDADGTRYFARVPVGSTVPASVTFSNDSDVPVAKRQLAVTDGVTITSATYDTDQDELVVTARSTDQVDPPTLTLTGLAEPVELVDGTAVVETSAPPATVTVASSGGGTDAANVVVGGAAAGDPAATLAAISGPTQAVAGDVVTLSSASLNAQSLVWDQTAGVDVGVDGSTGEEILFTAPEVGGTLTFTLTATGPGGATSTTEPFTVEVLTERPAPVAVATATPSTALVGQTVTVSGTGSSGAASYAWEQLDTGAPDVVIGDSTGPSFSFAMPATASPITFRLTVDNGDGVTSTAEVTVTQVQDVLTVGQAQYRPDKSEWRLDGTASVTTANTVRVYVRNVDGTRGALIGEGVASAPGQPGDPGPWTVRVKGGPNPGTATQVLVESTRGGSTVATFQRK